MFFLTCSCQTRSFYLHEDHQNRATTPDIHNEIVWICRPSMRPSVVVVFRLVLSVTVLVELINFLNENIKTLVSILLHSIQSDPIRIEYIPFVLVFSIRVDLCSTITRRRDALDLDLQRGTMRHAIRRKTTTKINIRTNFCMIFFVFLLLFGLFWFDFGHVWV